MKKLIIPIVLLIGVSCSTQKETYFEYELSEALNNVQNMRQWMIEDKVSGVIEVDYADYYIELLNESEDLLIKHFNQLNTNQER